MLVVAVLLQRIPTLRALLTRVLRVHRVRYDTVLLGLVLNHRLERVERPLLELLPVANPLSNPFEVLERDVRTLVAFGFFDDCFRTLVEVVFAPAAEPVTATLEGLVGTSRTRLLQAGTAFLELAALNWEEQRRVVAERHAELKNKRRDFLHKLSNHYAREYDLVAVEDLDAAGLVELPGNSRNRAGAASGTFLRMLKYKCEREGTHFVAVDPAGTTKECAACGVSTEKPLWIREHSCPSCGFTADRDWNAAWNILSRGIQRLGEGRSESTPVETALPTGTTTVPAQRVGEAGSPTRTREPSGER